MRRIILLLLVALLTITILLFIYNPKVLDGIWLWIVGLIGPITALVRNGASTIADTFKREESSDIIKKQEASSSAGKEMELTAAQVLPTSEKEVKELREQIKELEEKLKGDAVPDAFPGITLTVLRYFDDGETTLGFLFFENDFFCYTLEDTHREKKVVGATRIPAGTYRLAYNRQLTPLTRKYRETRPWFEYHLHVKEVPNYTGVYIHSGSTHKHTEGCLLVADSIYSSSEKRSIFNSRVTFEKLYKKLQPILNQEKAVRIKYFDEDWFAQANLSQLKTI